MKIVYIESLSDFKRYDNLILTIGNFDGVHLGHQSLLNALNNDKVNKKAVMTFTPHPVSFLKDETFKTLFDTSEKIEQMKKYNIDYLFIVNFSLEFSRLTVSEFISKLKILGVNSLVLGKDYRFSYRGSGTIEDLKKHFNVILASDITKNKQRVSTTLIKTALLEGKLTDANKMLGYNFSISGIVSHGDKVGRTLGFPTANIDYKDSFLPKDGVYLNLVYIGEKKYYGIGNIGNNPTVNYSDKKRLEIYILDYNDVIYEKNVKVEFLEYIRNEIKFSSKEELIEKIKSDELYARNYILNQNL